MNTKKKTSIKKRFIRYMRKTWKNKLVAIILVSVGTFTVFCPPPTDGLFCMFSWIFGTIMFFDTQSWFVD